MVPTPRRTPASRSSCCARGDSEGARAEAEQALSLSPNLAAAHAALGAALVFAGRPKDGAAALQKSIRLDPHHHRSPTRLNQMAISHYLLGEYEAALDVADRAIRSHPEYPLFYRWRAASLGQLGRLEDARRALDQAIAMSPTSFEIYVRDRVPWMRPEDHAHMLDGLRKAGWAG
jgi:adenylate cyclase